MRERWSVRGLASLAVGLAFVSALPVFGIAYYRLARIRTDAPVWAQLANAGRALSESAVCEGGAGPGQAVADLERWRTALARVGDARELGRAHVLRDRAAAAREELVGILGREPAVREHWVRSRCQEMARLGERVLSDSLALGLDPSTRSGRHEDLAVRDLTAYLAVWVAAATGLVVWIRGAVVRPARRLARVLRRIADGDLSAEVPAIDGGEMLELARAVQRAVDEFEERDEAKSERIVELRDLVRRTLEVIAEPVLVVGGDHHVDFANHAAAEAFGEPLDAFEGAELTRLPGGEAVIAAADEIMREGEAHVDRLVSTHPLRREQHLARCAVVRDPRGAPSRVIMVLRAAEGAWWRRLFRPSEEAPGS